MRKKRNPWVSIADMLSSVVLIFLLLYVMASLDAINKQETIEKLEAAQELQNADVQKQIAAAIEVHDKQQKDKMNRELQQMLDMMKQLEKALAEYEKKGLVQVYVDRGMLELTSVTFASGSAELAPQTRKLIAALASKLKPYLDNQKKMEILVEGHTDPAPIGRVVNKGGFFADNIQLSTLRASNVRKAILSNIGGGYGQRIGVSGYGETRLKNKTNKYSPENRRIEIRILWNGQGNK